jgi:hypothetical protein
VVVQKLCQEQMITGFPSIRIYRKGSDDIVVHGFHEHEAYRGDRTQTALQAFVDKVVTSAGQPATRSSDTRRMTLGQGCMVRSLYRPTSIHPRQVNSSSFSSSSYST